MIRFRRIFTCIAKELRVGADPVRQHDEAGEGVLERRSVRELRSASLESGGKPSATRGDQRIGARGWVEAETRRPPGLLVACVTRVGSIGAAVVADGRNEQAGGSGSPVPERPETMAEDILPQCCEGLCHVSGGRTELGPALRLKPEVELADVVERGKHGQAGPPDVVEIDSAGQAGQAGTPEREREQGLRDGGDIGAVVEQRVPFGHCSLLVSFEFSPECCWGTAHL